VRIKTLITIPEMLNIFPTPIVFEREKPIMLKISENRAVDDVKIRIRTELPLMANAKLSTKFRSVSKKPTVAEVLCCLIFSFSIIQV